jgi:hypothetical protein
LAIRWLARWSASRLPEVKKSRFSFLAAFPPHPPLAQRTTARAKHVKLHPIIPDLEFMCIIFSPLRELYGLATNFAFLI